MTENKHGSNDRRSYHDFLTVYVLLGTSNNKRQKMNDLEAS